MHRLLRFCSKPVHIACESENLLVLFVIIIAASLLER